MPGTESIQTAISHYVATKLAYQKALLRGINELIDENQECTDALEDIVLDAYGREAAEDDGMDAVVIHAWSLQNLSKYTQQLQKSIKNVKTPRSLEELQNDWQYNMHAQTHEAANKTKYLGGLSEENSKILNPLMQKALLAYCKCEDAFNNLDLDYSSPFNPHAM